MLGDLLDHPTGSEPTLALSGASAKIPSDMQTERQSLSQIHEMPAVVHSPSKVSDSTGRSVTEMTATDDAEIGTAQVLRISHPSRGDEATKVPE